MRYLSIIILGIALLSCNPNKEDGYESYGGDAMEVPDERVPPPASACAFISEEEVAKIIKVDRNLLSSRAGGSSEDSRACFYRWDDPNFENAAVLIQVLANPVFDELPEWPANFIQAKMRHGEGTVGSEEPTLFDVFNGVGDGGAYSYVAGKYYWRHKNDLVFMLAFNTDFNEKEQARVARRMGKLIMKNFKDLQSS